MFLESKQNSKNNNKINKMKQKANTSELQKGNKEEKNPGKGTKCCYRHRTTFIFTPRNPI